MDFFDHQERAHRNTRRLIIYFALAVIGIIVVLQLLAAWGLGESPLNPHLLLMVAGGVVVVVAFGSILKIVELSQGGGVVAQMLGGRQVDPHSTDPLDARLHNVVEEMAIASGVPVPDIYVLDNEQGINAFAAGNKPSDAVVAVTRGTLENLSRDELQGVVAHEFSHILNGDMRINIRLIGILNGILFLAILGQILFRTGFLTGGSVRSNRDSGSSGQGQLAILAIGVGLLVVGSIGLFFGRLIKAAVSRQREFLADASAVQFTRNPDGIAGALWKIGHATSRLEAPRAEEASHLFFSNGLGQALSGMFATHPPIPERINAIAPNFDPSSLHPVETSRPTVPPPLPPESVTPMATTASAGRLSPRDLIVGAAVMASLPQFAVAASREASGAVTMIYSLLLSVDERTRRRQLSSLVVDEGQRRQVELDLARRDSIPPDAWLPTVDLCLPALRKLSADQYRTFRANVRKLVEADGQVDLFEFVLHKALVRHLDAFFERRPEPAPRFSSLQPLVPDLQVILSALAFFDSNDPGARQSAYRAGVESLPTIAGGFPAGDPAFVSLPAIERALDRLALADGPTKRSILNACSHGVMADGNLEPRQGALLRAVADSLGCPIPPFAREGAQVQTTTV